MSGSDRGERFADDVRYWAWLGCVNFGGPAGQIALMHRDLVERRRWISEERFLGALNFCMLLPGPEALQLAVYLGWLRHRLRGALAAGVLFVLPSAVLLWALAWVYVAWGEVPAVAGALRGIQPVVLAIVVEAILRIGRRAFRGPLHLALAAGAFLALAASVPFPLVIGLAAAIGALLGSAPKDPGATTAAVEPVEPAPREKRPPAGARRALSVLACGLVLGAAPWLVLRAGIGGMGGMPVVGEVYRFFVQAALVGFGGAYSVLGYTATAAVERFGWLSSAEMIDALALAETTPGPLLIVVQFVGFLAGWHEPGTASPLLAASLGALAASWATFLPAFVLVLLGAPWVERLVRRPALAAALAGVTAAVVGVILDLAVGFAREALAPAGRPDVAAALLAVLALAALVRWRVPPVAAIVAGALLGLGRSLLLG